MSIFGRRTGATFCLGSFLCLFSALAPGLEPARMALPADLEARTERLAADGFGGKNRGSYVLGAHSGDFTRIESRLAVLDPLFASNRGSSSFTLTGPAFDQPISASCSMRSGTATVGVVTFDPKKLAYQCELASGGRPMAGTFVLGQKRPGSLRERLLARAERVGHAEAHGVRIDVRSVHELAGSRFKSAEPVGYLFELDGRAIGAIELTDVDPVVFLPPSDSPELRTVSLITALALSVFRDPAESALDD